MLGILKNKLALVWGFARKPISRISNHWLIVVVVVLFVAAVGIVGEQRKHQKIDERSIQKDQWITYADGYVGIKFNYPPDWEIVRKAGERSIVLRSADRKASLTLCVSSTKIVNPSCTKSNFAGRQLEPAGTLPIFGMNISRDKVLSVTGDRGIEYYYPKEPQAIEDGWYFTSMLSANMSQVQEVNLNLDQDNNKVIAEKVLSSLQKIK
jgi:hypothetical protein